MRSNFVREKLRRGEKQLSVVLWAWEALPSLNCWRMPAASGC